MFLSFWLLLVLQKINFYDSQYWLALLDSDEIEGACLAASQFLGIAELGLALGIAHHPDGDILRLYWLVGLDMNIAKAGVGITFPNLLLAGKDGERIHLVSPAREFHGDFIHLLFLGKLIGDPCILWLAIALLFGGLIVVEGVLSFFLVTAIDVGTCGLEIIVERKSLVEFVGDVEEHILWNTAIVGFEVLVVPLETLTAGALTIVPGVIHTYDYDIFTFYNIRCQVESACHHTILGISHFLTIEPDVGTEAHALKLDEILAVAHFLDMEVLAIPHDGVAEVFDGNLERFFLVEGTRQRNLFPTGILVVCLFCSLEVAHLEQPSSIEIEFCPFYCIHLA